MHALSPDLSIIHQPVTAGPSLSGRPVLGSSGRVWPGVPPVLGRLGLVRARQVSLQVHTGDCRDIRYVSLPASLHRGRSV